MNDIEELQKTLFTIYSQNLDYLKNNHTLLYSRIKKFEEKNIENYYIDFQDNYFELVDSKNSKATYNCNSFYDAECRATNIKESKAIFSMLVNEIDPMNFNLENEISAHKFVQEILDLKQEDKESQKFIFIGTLLGIHINEIHKSIVQKAYLIVEPTLEVFRLSLFFTDYQTISKTSKLFFSIEEDELELKHSIYQFLEYDFSQNHHIKFELASEKEFYLVDTIKNILTSASPFINAFSEDILSLERGLKNINNTNGLLDIKKLDIFENKPVLILGAGPSLEKYQDFIRKNHQSFIVLAVTAALKRLEEIDVIPDIIVGIDKKEKEILEQLNVNKKYYENSICFLGPKTNSKIIDLLSNNSFIVQENFQLFKELKTISCVSAGDFSCKLAIELGAKEIYLLGIDASFDKEKTHDSLHRGIEVNPKNTYVNNIIEVEGNFKNIVKTNLLYNEIIDSFNKFNLNNNVSIYNLSDGAKLKNTKSLKANDFSNYNHTSIEKNSFYKVTKNILKENSLSNKVFDNTIEKEVLLSLKKKYNDKAILELRQKTPNSKVLVILKRFFKLINPYITSKEAERKKKVFLKTIIKSLEKIYLT